jgi:hypothetical protein
MPAKSTKKATNTTKKAKTSLVPARSTIIPAGSNVAAIELMIRALDELGRLEKIDSARLEIARQLAQQVDENPTNGFLWKQYRDAENALRTVGNGPVDDFAALMRTLDSEVRDAENRKPAKSRSRSSGDS